MVSAPAGPARVTQITAPRGIAQGIALVIRLLEPGRGGAELFDAAFEVQRRGGHGAPRADSQGRQDANGVKHRHAFRSEVLTEKTSGSQKRFSPLYLFGYRRSSITGVDGSMVTN